MSIDFAVFIFFADLIAGVVQPTFSLFAQAMGGSLVLIGVLATANGATRLLVSVPLGALSDIVGRRPILVGGMALLSVASALFTVAPSASLLFFPNILFGLAILATLALGPAYVGDLLEPSQRAKGIALITIAMGAGYAVGPALGGVSASHLGYSATYRGAAAIGLITAALAWHRFGKHQVMQRAPWSLSAIQRVTVNAALDIIRDGPVAIASLGNFVFSLTFATAITVFLPVYAHELGISAQGIGLMFMVRGLASTIGRAPLGILSDEVSARFIILVSVLGEGAVILAIALTRSVVWLTVLLAFEGICFGAFQIASQTYLVRRPESSYRGASLGIYSMAGTLGTTSGGLMLGVIAELFGVSGVFAATALLVCLALGAMLSVGRGTHGVLGTNAGPAKDANANR